MSAAPRTLATHRWTVHVLVAGAGLVAALLLRAPAVTVLVAPSALLVAAAIAWRPRRPAEIRLDVDGDRMLTGDRTTVRVTVVTSGPVAVDVPVSGPLTAAGPTSTLALPDGTGRVVLDVPLRAARWGAARIGPPVTRSWSPGGLAVATVTGTGADVRVLPRTPAAATLVRPRATHAAHGHQHSPSVGEGTEFADLRPFLPGDRARDVSPVTTARRGSPWVVRRHPERRTDVVLLLDAHDPTEVDAVFDAARAVARGHLQQRDRVGVTTMTGVLRWLPPGDGARHEHRIAAALVDARLSHSWVRPAVEQLPRRVLPPGALVLGISPGTDDRFATTAVELHRRGWDVAVLVVAPAAGLPTDTTDDPATAAARRLVALERRAVRDRLLGHGVSAVTWDPATPVDVGLGALRTIRRHRRAGRRA